MGERGKATRGATSSSAHRAPSETALAAAPRAPAHSRHSLRSNRPLREKGSRLRDTRSLTW